ncbi:hypothetical protein ACJ2A9_21670 [Anaerobacillus sp. MEB173]|uniref:hypothetical protein n=1 Tax=Anaerobacillus sp. MEB173 TaxID=3383345 RepID=UPI003F901CF6
MITVHYYENKNLLLSQLLENVPSVGDNVKIKKRKGKVVSITKLDEMTLQVQVTLEVIKKNVTVDPSKKKKR